MQPGLFDTHCHLNIAESYPEPGPYIERARKAGVIKLAIVGVDLESSRRAVEIAEAFEGASAVVGRHPNYAADYDPSELKQFEELLNHPRVVALGEIGLDRHWDYATPEQQHRCLLDQLDLAHMLNVPIVFHCREAYSELLSIIEEQTALTWNFHCFSGDAQDAQRAVAIGAYFGVDGPLTYKKAETTRELVRQLPRNKVLLETDSPYLSPEPVRGKANEPANLPYINRVLAQVWDISEDETASITTENALRFFRL